LRISFAIIIVVVIIEAIARVRTILKDDVSTVFIKVKGCLLIPKVNYLLCLIKQNWVSASQLYLVSVRLNWEFLVLMFWVETIKVKGYAQIRQENEAYPGGSKGKKRRFYQNVDFNLVVTVVALQAVVALMQTSQIAAINLLKFE